MIAEKKSPIMNLIFQAQWFLLAVKMMKENSGVLLIHIIVKNAQ
jgi:hypothetical protein